MAQSSVTGSETGEAGATPATPPHGWLAIVAVAVIGVFLSYAQFLYFDSIDQARIASALELRTGWRAQDFEHKLRFASADAEALASFMATERGVTPQRFQDFVGFSHRDNIFGSVLYWAAWVSDQQRDGFVAATRAIIGPDFQIVDRAADGQFVPSPRRPAYLVHVFEEQVSNLGSVSGLDMLRVPGRPDLVARVRDGGEPLGTPPVSLMMGHGVRGFVVLWPVYETAAVPPTVEQRREMFRGAVVARFPLESLLNGVMANTPGITGSIDLLMGPGAEARPVASFDPKANRWLLTGAGPKVPAAGTITLRKEFDVYGQHWTLVSHFPPDLIGPLRAPARWFSLSLGLALTVLITGMLRRAQLRQRGIEAAVIERTASLYQEIGERKRQEAATRDLAERLRAVLDTALHPIILTDQDGIIELFNPAAEALFRYAAEEVLGANVRMLMPLPYSDQHDGFLGDYQRTGVSAAIGRTREAVGMRKDGTTFPLELSIGEAKGDGTSIFVAMITDLSERRQQEGTLRRWADAFEKVAFGIAIVDVETDRLELVNPALAAMVRAPVADLMGRGIYDFHPAAERLRLSSRADVADARGRSSFETEYLRVDGTVFPARVNVSVVPAPGGHGLNRIATIFDITEERRIEAALRESRHRSDELLALLDTLYDEAPVGLAFLDRDFCYVRINTALAEMNGMPATAHLGRSVEDVLPDLWPHVSGVFQAILGTGKPIINVPISGHTALPDQGPRHWLVSCYPVRVGEITIGVGLIVLEVSRQHQIEEQLRQAQKMEAIGNLTGGMAHDFNNLLGVIIGNLDLAQRMLQPGTDMAETITEAQDAALRGAELTRRLLAFARRQPLRQQRVAINDLVDGVNHLLRRTLGEQISIVLELDPIVWPVEVDQAQLEACLVNLATNARDAMSDGGTLTICTGNRTLDGDYAERHADVTPGDYAMIEVSDTGLGMAQDVVSRIFEPFCTTKEPGRGTGLGLSMVFGFVKQSSGHITVYSEVGHGTVFRLYLPRMKDGHDTDAVPQTVVPRQGANEMILVVEDNAALRRVVVRQLRGLGYQVHEAENADAALAMLEHENVDLVMTDVVMPGSMDGFGLARVALERWPHLRVLFTSGFPETRINGNLGPQGGSARLLGKPYRLDQLAQAVRDALEA